MPVADVVSAVAELKARPGYRLYRDYHGGRHRYAFATPKFLEKYGWVLDQARENLCPGVVSAFTDRLSMQSWGEKTALDEADKQGLSRLLNMVNREAYRCGDAYTLTWNGADGSPKARYHRADSIVPKVSDLDPDVLDWAAKFWTHAEHGRVNVYYPDRVERYVTVAPLINANTEKGATRLDWPDDNTSYKLFSDDDSDTIGHDFDGVPVCWWKRDADDQAGYGRSVLHDVIPVQDELNKFVADMIVASERIALPIRYALQMEMLAQTPRLDPKTGKPAESKPVKFDPTLQSILALPGAGPVGEFPGPDADKLIGMQNHAAHKIARVTGVPAYYFSQTSGDVPSGESLRVLSSRLISSVRDFQQDSTPVWRGQLQLLGFDNPSPAWEDPMPMDEAEKVEVALGKKELGFSLADLVTFLGEADPEGVLSRALQADVERQAAAVNVFNAGQLLG